MNPRKRLVFLMIQFFILYSSSRSVVSSQDITFHFSSLSLRNLTLLGDSYLRNGVVGLTRETGVPSSSSGTVIYNSPIPFLDRSTNSTASFSTRFSFTIKNVNPSSSFGDGLSFFLSPDSHTLGSPGGYLGLVNSSQLTKNKFIAIEFDTWVDGIRDVGCVGGRNRRCWVCACLRLFPTPSLLAFEACPSFLADQRLSLLLVRCCWSATAGGRNPVVMA